MEFWVTGYKFESWPFKDHSCHVCFKLAFWFQRKIFLNIFPIGPYVKTMSVDGGHLGWRSGSQEIIESWPPKDHSYHVCFKLTYWFQRRRLLNIFPIGSYVKTMFADGCHLGWRSESQDSWPPKDHSSHVCFKLTYWFQRRRLLNIFSIGSYVKIKSRHGGHLEFPIGKRFTILVQDHPMIIPAKLQFNWLSGF